MKSCVRHVGSTRSREGRPATLPMRGHTTPRGAGASPRGLRQHGDGTSKYGVETTGTLSVKLWTCCVRFAGTGHPVLYTSHARIYASLLWLPALRKCRLVRATSSRHGFFFGLLLRPDRIVPIMVFCS